MSQLNPDQVKNFTRYGPGHAGHYQRVRLGLMIEVSASFSLFFPLIVVLVRNHSEEPKCFTS